MDAIDKSLADIEAEWEQVAANAIAESIASNPSEDLYAAGFWLFYCDYTVIHPPCFALNTKSHLAKAQDKKYHRWSPPNWKFDVVDGTTDAMMPSYVPLHGDHSDETWPLIIERHKLMISNVCRSLTWNAKEGAGRFQGISLNPKFVVGIFEGQNGPEEYEELVELSVDYELVEELRILKR